MASRIHAVEYAFSNSAPQADLHLSSLEQYLDPMSISCLAPLVPAGSGMRCLELGPGRGSIAHWLVNRVGPAGEVVAIDRDPSQVRPEAGLTIVQHNLQDGPAVAGPFDLIHARMVLLHLPNREPLVRQLTDLLAPGGSVVIGEFRSSVPPAVLTAPSEQDAALFSRLVTQTLDLISNRYGLDNSWGERVHLAMAAGGLSSVSIAAYDGVWTGGGPGCELFAACARQKQAELIMGGIAEADLHRFYALLQDPRFSVRAWPFVCVSGQRVE